MIHQLLSAAPVLLGNAVRPPLNPLTGFVGLGGIGLGVWLVWMGLAFDRPARKGTTPPAPSPPPAVERPARDPRKGVV